MKLFLIEAAVAFFGLLAVMAIVFRSKWARDTLRFARNLAWLMVGMMALLATFEAVRMLW